MNSKQQALCVLVGGVGLGIVSLASPSVRDFTDGLLGRQPESSETAGRSVELKADLASPMLRTPLQGAQLDELAQGLVYLLHDQYPRAVPILGKYAMLGDKGAQNAVGAMYYFGMGVPLDREEGVRWLRLAAAQGDQSDNETLAAAINGTWEWEHSGSEFAYAQGSAAAPRYDFNPVTGNSSFTAPASVLDSTPSFGTVRPSSPAKGARASIDQAYGDEPASGRFNLPAAPSQPLSFGSPVILNGAGPGTYSDGSGDIYAQAGPHGVVNTQTGEFSPTN